MCSECHRAICHRTSTVQSRHRPSTYVHICIISSDSNSSANQSVSLSYQYSSFHTTLYSGFVAPPVRFPGIICQVYLKAKRRKGGIRGRRSRSGLFFRVTYFASLRLSPGTRKQQMALLKLRRSLSSRKRRTNFLDAQKVMFPNILYIKIPLTWTRTSNWSEGHRVFLLSHNDLTTLLFY